MISIDDIKPNGEQWIVKKNRIFFKKCQFNIPVCIMEDDIIYIFLDNNSMHSVIFKLLKNIIKLNIKFYFYPPSYSNPSTIIDNDEIIYHYFLTYMNKEFFHGFKKLEFDIIHNMIDWANEEKCFSLIKDNYMKAKSKVNRFYYNHYTKIKNYDYEEEIRDEFDSLYREIIMLQLLN